MFSMELPQIAALAALAGIVALKFHLFIINMHFHQLRGKRICMMQTKLSKSGGRVKKMAKKAEKILGKTRSFKRMVDKLCEGHCCERGMERELSYV